MFMANHSTETIITMFNPCSQFPASVVVGGLQYTTTQSHTQTHQPAHKTNDPWSTQAGPMHVNSTGTMPAGMKTGLSGFRPPLTTEGRERERRMQHPRNSAF